ncbi:hypothetical protein PF005_g10361 [Phytophthora fragariae]|uniref:Uncharacterized protein n=1 Tax=Phytophthora fragariae TaxID=53985 RepID=A0A6A3Y6H9_9STRA|nr:hypothetical protein PF011_g14583 [Phytophthora fragariae]KAE9213028.1 hypothetical protein PF005_g10361 [Phytophthora fragariae]KAE9230579.1 hypothetical protein PF004_g10453 [Phytophthora fragariae]KAE9234972.1 hypothetical protein PF002_g11657 [Phytophthora fragariae]KAE9315315.1 hypothetical protein PF001_g7854 [Phytophthora fragariae]
MTDAEENRASPTTPRARRSLAPGDKIKCSMAERLPKRRLRLMVTRFRIFAKVYINSGYTSFSTVATNSIYGGYTCVARVSANTFYGDDTNDPTIFSGTIYGGGTSNTSVACTIIYGVCTPTSRCICASNLSRSIYSSYSTFGRPPTSYTATCSTDSEKHGWTEGYVRRGVG